MANDVQYLIDMLYEMIDTAKTMPMARDKCVIVREDALDLLDDLRGQLPAELKKAQDLIRARAEYVEYAKKEAEKIRRQAELDAKTKVSESEVIYAAKEKARQIVGRAEERSRQLYQVANSYAEDALARTEEAVQAALDEVKQSRVRFRTTSAAKMQEQRQKLEKKNEESET